MNIRSILFTALIAAATVAILARVTMTRTLLGIDKTA